VRGASLVLVTLAAVAHASGQDRPQTDEYREVYAGDLIGGYVKPGEKVETTGFVAVYRGEIFLKVNLPSAQWPLRMDVSRLSQKTVRQITTSCTSDNDPLTTGGCTARIRGEVTPPVDRRPGLIADTIEVLGPPR